VRCAPQRLGTAPSALTLDDLEAPVLGSLLEHLEHARGTSARSRHVRLAAMHACFHVASRRAPSQGGVIHRVWASPRQRDDRPPIALLPGAAIDALLAVPDPHTWAGRRARTLRLVAVQIGLRISALIGLCWPDVTCGTGAHVSCPGTGRKTRCTPRRQDAITA
jgi:integrase/recombinase XerD